MDHERQLIMGMGLITQDVECDNFVTFDVLGGVRMTWNACWCGFGGLIVTESSLAMSGDLVREFNIHRIDRSDLGIVFE
jgi:hypothetical protein